MGLFEEPSSSSSLSSSVARNSESTALLTSIRPTSSSAAFSSKVSTSTLNFVFTPAYPSSQPTLTSNIRTSSSNAFSSPTAAVVTTASLTYSVPTTMLGMETAVMMPADVSPASGTFLPFSAQSQQAGATAAPTMYYPHQTTIMSKGARIAAIVLGLFGLIALILGVVVCLTRRRRRSKEIQRGLEEDAMFDPRNTNFLATPEPSFTKPNKQSLNQVNNNSNNNNNVAHMTRSTERSNTLFGPGPYVRPETVTTERRNLPTPPTPNPFLDLQRNKAYDVLGGRPRSTTLTDRGSWVKNPFRDPKSGRYDPFGELTEKAERAKYLDEQRREAELMREYEEMERAKKVGARQAAEALREAELAREYEEMERAFQAKEAMGLAPEGLKMQPRNNGPR